MKDHDEREPNRDELGSERLPTEVRDEPDELLSPASQIGRATQTGGTPESGREPDEDAREGWPMPDQTDIPSEWPEPTTDG
jgi:hypothetical protein